LILRLPPRPVESFALLLGFRSDLVSESDSRSDHSLNAWKCVNEIDFYSAPKSCCR